MSRIINRFSQQEQLNFLLTNRIPRRLATQFIGWFSKIENEWLTRTSIRIWRAFAGELNLAEARKTRFSSLHDCFIRELRDGARPVDQRKTIVTSPCDAIVGSFGRIENGTVFQAKGFPYDISDLIADPELQRKYREGTYVTLRLTSTMYHRFHAPVDCSITEVTYISGDTWNVNPIALKRIEKLFCKNERVVIELKTDNPACGNITLVPVAAILVASIRLNWLNETLDLKYRGPNVIRCDAQFKKGDELGYFQHGSTIIVFAEKGYRLDENLRNGAYIATGEPLLTMIDGPEIRKSKKSLTNPGDNNDLS